MPYAALDINLMCKITWITKVDYAVCNPLVGGSHFKFSVCLLFVLFDNQP